MKKLLSVCPSTLGLLFLSAMLNAEASNNYCTQEPILMTCWFIYDLGGTSAVPTTSNLVSDPNFTPPPYIVDLGTTTSKIWRVVNLRDDTATLYASWTPPNSSNYGIFSPNQYGPFKLPYGQRWELIPKRSKHSGQDVKVEIDPVMGAQQARLYMWWEMRGTFYWDSVYDFKFNGGYNQLPAILNLILDD